MKFFPGDVVQCRYNHKNAVVIEIPDPNRLHWADRLLLQWEDWEKTGDGHNGMGYQKIKIRGGGYWAMPDELKLISSRRKYTPLEASIQAYIDAELSNV